MNDYVIILGTGPSRVNCPWDGEVWAVNNAYEQWTGKKIDKIFVVHKQAYWDKGAPIFNWEEMNKTGAEIISLWENKGLNAIPYPYYEIKDFFQIDYFSNTFCYMIAYALYKDYKTIRLSGCDMSEYGEVSLEKGGVEFWIGIARGRGAKIVIDEGSMLLKTLTGRPYGTIEADTDVLAGRKANISIGLVDSKSMELINKEKIGSVRSRRI